MRLIISAAVFIATSCAAQTLEYKRPTADVQTTVTSGCSGTNVASSSMSAVYTGKSGVGPTGSFASIAESGSAVGLTEYQARQFNTWQSTSSTYATLTLNVSVSCSVSNEQPAGSGECFALYSTDSGSTWRSLYGYTTRGSTDPQNTSSAVITGTPLANLRVSVCAGGTGGIPPDSGLLVVYDIWTTGIISTTSQPQTQVVQ